MRVAIGDHHVHPVGLGTMTALTGPGHWWHPDDLDAVRHLLRGAIDHGVDHLDTADAYGPETAEHLIRKALHPYPSHLLIATKGGMTRSGPNQWARCGRPEYLRQCVALSLRRLKTECIDLYYLHRVDPAVPLADQIGVLIDLRAEGKIRHIGLSQVTLDHLQEAQALTPIAAVQNRYHQADTDSRDVVEHCGSTGVAFVAHSPLAQGALIRPNPSPGHRRPSTAELLRWVLEHGPHVATVPGTRSLAHLQKNLSAMG